MRHATLWISKFLTLLALLSLTACALFEERAGPPMTTGSRDQVYNSSYDDVWKAVNLVLQPYPLRVSNMDQGILETDILRGDKAWVSPFQKEGVGSGETYKLTIRVIKGNAHNTKVTINKDSQVQVDFFSDPKPLPSDGMEEKSILYRITRELQIERALARAQKKQNQNQQQAPEQN